MAITHKQRLFPTCYGPEFIAEAVRKWIAAVGAQTAYIEPGSPWKNGYVESFNTRLRDELLHGEIFLTCFQETGPIGWGWSLFRRFLPAR